MELNLRDGLNLITLITAIISLSMSCMALWPHCKGGLAIIRDALLWFALVVVMVIFGFAGWRQATGPAVLDEIPKTARDASRPVEEWQPSRRVLPQRTSWVAPTRE